MSRIAPILPVAAKGEAKELFSTLEKKVGGVPNIFQCMANSPQVLKAYMNLSEASNHLSLNPKLREEVALVIAQANQCNYCLSAHSAIAGKLGIPTNEILLARKGEASDPKTQAILKFVKLVVEKRGHVSTQEVETLKAAGVNDSEIAEITLLIAVNFFTNYFNHIVDTDIDFPLAPALKS